MKILKGKNFTLYCADNEKVIPLLDYKNSVIITSPPYNLNRKYDNYVDNNSEYYNFLYRKFNLLYQKAEKDTRFIVILKDNFSDFDFINFEFYSLMKKIGWKFFGYYVVESSHISKYTAWGSWCSASAPRIRINHEMIQVYYKETYKRLNKGKSTISPEKFKEYTLSLIKGNSWFSKEINKKEHPAQFSPVLIDRLINLFSYENDTVIDIFNGVGNTGLSAIRNGRKYIGIDISEKYILTTYKKLEAEENKLF